MSRRIQMGVQNSARTKAHGGVEGRKEPKGWRDEAQWTAWKWTAWTGRAMPDQYGAEWARSSKDDGIWWS